MDKNAIKKYAVWARNELISRVTQKAEQYEITEKKITPADADSIGGRVLSATEKKQRKALIAKIYADGFGQVMEEVAYTWFNRFTALRFMEVNNYLPSHTRVFTNEAGEFKPQILADAIQLEMDGLDIDKVYELKDANKTEELYKYLLTVQCNALSDALPGIFQRINDFSELLIPDYLLRAGSIIEQMISVIPTEDWLDQVQIIGWLYQYYISDPKDVLINAKKQYKDSDIPFVTQIFTSDWIVQYMVQNSLGRSWINCTGSDYSKYGWEYYLAERNPVKESQKINPINIRVVDPCMGSGHIIAYVFGELVSKLEQQIDNQLRMKPWVLKNNGERTTVQNVNYLPGWLEQEEKKQLANAQPQIGYNLYSDWFYEGIEKIEKLLSKYGAIEVSQEILRELITDPDKANALGERIAAKIFVYCYRGVLADPDKLGGIYIPTAAGYLKLSDTNDSSEIGQDFFSILSTMLSPKEKTTLSDQYAVFGSLKKPGKSQKKPTASPVKLPSKQMAMAVNKWKSPIQNCLSVEIFEGRSGKDVSRKCEDYSIESVDAMGNTSYIAVKKVKSIGDSFALSEKEYAAAQRLGKNYKVFVISQDGEKVEYLYITNPCDTVTLDKTVKEWEFICNSYDIPEQKDDESDDTLVDERMLKYLAADYFVSNQKAFLKDLLTAGEMAYDASLSDMVEKINGVVDFYTGETLLDIRDDQVIMERSKKNAIKKILGL